MRLILVRHGDAHAGFHGVVGGQTGCTGLTPLGRAQAEVLREHLAASGRVRADVLLASTLPRAEKQRWWLGPVEIPLDDLTGWPARPTRPRWSRSTTTSGATMSTT